MRIFRTHSGDTMLIVLTVGVEWSYFRIARTARIVVPRYARRSAPDPGRFGRAPRPARESPTRSIPTSWNTSVARGFTRSNCPGRHEFVRNTINFGLEQTGIRGYNCAHAFTVNHYTTRSIKAAGK